MKTKALDIAGRRFGRLIAIKPEKYKIGRKTIWLCICDCGNETRASIDKLNSGEKKSCGCLKKSKAVENLKKIKKVHSTHNQSKTRLYNIYTHMKGRCNNQNNKKYSCYGARGIKVCKEWLESYEKFAAWAKLNGYSDGLTIERIDVNGDYSPQNCKWISMKDQCHNKQNTIRIDDNGELLSVKDFSNKYSIPEKTVFWRISHNWNIDRLKQPVRGKCHEDQIRPTSV